MWTDAVKGGKASRNYEQAQRNTGIARITMSPSTSMVKKKKKILTLSILITHFLLSETPSAWSQLEVKTEAQTMQSTEYSL